jgi:3-keto-disaccharide hydrolase
LNGLSVRLIESHYENNYGGALRRLNAITEQIESLDFASTPAHVLNGLKREELVARANALENNVSLYFTSQGRRNTLEYVDAPVPAGAWHTLRVEFAGKRIRVALNGKWHIDHEDGHITGAGAVGLWTKADSVTAFDDFSYGAAGT